MGERGVRGVRGERGSNYKEGQLEESNLLNR